MSASYDKSTAVVVLPAVGGGRLQDRRLQSWLGRSDLVQHLEPVSLLELILREIDRPMPTEGLAALRMWGQTGDRPTVWMAAADPVYLEPQLDHLRLHALSRQQLSPGELRQLINHLQLVLGADSSCSFARVGPCGYLNASAPIATAELPAAAIHGLRPDAYLPAGEASAGHRKLVSEIEMALHDHAVNVERQADGLQPVNSLWLWGGGTAPEQTTEWHPPLFANEPLLGGYWASKTGLVAAWPGSIAACIEESLAGFVAVVPAVEQDVEVLESLLRELKEALYSDRLSSLVLLFRDGIRADVRRKHGLRVWRRRNTLLEAPRAEGQHGARA